MEIPPKRPSSLAVIINPTAGHRYAARMHARLRAALEAADVRFELVSTERPLHASALTRELSKSFDVIVAAGGDGTVHEVVTGLHASRSGAVLGIIPFGTGNDFGDLLNMPDTPEAALQALLTAETITVDAGKVRWRERESGPWHEAIFLNAVGIGFDALVAVEATRFKFFRGKSGYLAGIVSALLKWPQPSVRVERIGPSEHLLPDGSTRPTDGGALLHEGKLFLAGVGNGRTVGGGFTLTPFAIADDGLLDLCFVDDVRKLRLPILIPKVIKGTHLGEPEVVSERLSGLRIASPEYGLPMHFDGEVLTRSAVEIEVSVLPGAFRVLCPDPRAVPLKGVSGG
jgi:diacylglycerol kinase (ATP)